MIITSTMIAPLASSVFLRKDKFKIQDDSVFFRIRVHLSESLLVLLKLVLPLAVTGLPKFLQQHIIGLTNVVLIDLAGFGCSNCLRAGKFKDQVQRHVTHVSTLFRQTLSSAFPAASGVTLDVEPISWRQCVSCSRGVLNPIKHL